MAQTHTEAVQALLGLIDAEGCIATDAEKAQADLLVALVEDAISPWRESSFGSCSGWRNSRGRSSSGSSCDSSPVHAWQDRAGCGI
jgi:hypothetical protein